MRLGKTLHIVRETLSYRTERQVRTLRIYPNGDGYYLCPRCDGAIERDFVKFCSCCGQRLNWSARERAEEVYI